MPACAGGPDVDARPVRGYFFPVTAELRSDLDAIPAYVPGRSVPGAIKLASNESPGGPLPGVVEAIAAAAAGVARYPDNAAVALTEVIARKIGVPEANVVAGCGSVALCQQLVQITCAAGDEVVFSWRSFEAYPVVTRVAGATPVPVPNTAEHGHDLDAMAAAIGERTRLVFVCTPNNPTGTTISATELGKFLDKVPDRVLVVVDEAYFEYGDADDPDRVDGIRLAMERSNVITLRTFSKAYALAGIRVGYAVGSAAEIVALRKVSIPFSVNAAAQAAGIAALGAADVMSERAAVVVAERERVTGLLRDAGYAVPSSQGNFVWLPLGDDTAAFTADAAGNGLLVRGYGTDGVRVTIGHPDENDALIAFARTRAAAHSV